MTHFSYCAIDNRGREVRGTAEAASLDALCEMLAAQGLVPYETTHGAGGAGKTTAPNPKKLLGFTKRVDPEALTRGLATMLGAGISLDRALELMARTEASGSQKSWTKTLLADVLQGRPFSAALAQGDNVPTYLVAVVRAGEASGQLGQVLEEISSNMRRMREAREKIRSALIYPCLVVLLACGVLALLLSVLFPNLAPIFEASGTPLPGPLQMSQAVGAFFGDWWAFLGIGFLVSLLIVARLFRQPAYKQWLDQALLRLPLLGPLLAGIELSRAFRLLGVQLSHGVAHLDALRITGATVRNSHLACLLAKARDQVQEGASLSNSLAGEVFVPPVANQLIVAGETAGRLPAALLDISRILDTETQSRIDRLLTLLAPSLTILVGGLIGLMIWSVMGAVLSVNDIAAR